MADFETIIKGFASADGSIPSEAIANLVKTITTTVGNEFVDKARYKSKLDEINALKNDKQTAEDELATATGWKAKFENLKTEYDNYKTTQSAKETRTAKENALRNLLREVGISEKRLNTVIKVSDVDGLELENGVIKNADTLKNNVKTEWADFIVDTSTTGANTQNPPNTQAGVKSMADIYKKDDNGRYILSTADRQKALAENLSQNNAN